MIAWPSVVFDSIFPEHRDTVETDRSEVAPTVVLKVRITICPGIKAFKVDCRPRVNYGAKGWLARRLRRILGSSSTHVALVQGEEPQAEITNFFASLGANLNVVLI